MSRTLAMRDNSLSQSHGLGDWLRKSSERRKRQGTSLLVPKIAAKKSWALAPAGRAAGRDVLRARTINLLLRSFLLAVTVAFLVAWAIVGHAATPTTPDATALLKRSDTYRNGWPAFTLRVKITDYESGKSDEEHYYEVSQKGTDKTYVEFMSPREKGRHLLMLGDDMWIYLPDTSRPVRITPLERLSGDASNGDVARTNYAVDYSAEYVREEKVGNDNCYVLNLTAKRKGATYQRILYWVRTQDARPLRAEFYLTSGKHIKSATFDDYKESEGKLLLRKLTLYDEIRHNSHSVLEYSNAAPRNLPDKLFYQGRSDRF
jgi:outer membrane lipoprotein-sorting protein